MSLCVYSPETVESLGLSHAHMHKVLERFDILSLDVFDTIVARRCLNPADVFAWMEEYYQMPGFYQNRIEAEAKARKKNASRGQEVSIEEIYDCLSDSVTNRDEYIAREIASEKIFLFVNPNIENLIATAKALGKRVIAVSDIYFSAEQIRDLLETAGVTVDQIYTSADFREENLGKYNNRLYPRVLQLEGIGAQQVLHVGDNVRSDLENAAVHNIEALHTRNLHEAVRDQNSIARLVMEKASTKAGSIIAGQITSDIVRKEKPRGIFEQYGYAIGGPLVHGYLQYISQKAEEESIERLVLLERDGCIIAEAAATYTKECNVKWRLAPSSRRMSALPCLAHGDSAPLIKLFETKKISEAEFFQTLSLPPPPTPAPDSARMALPAEHIKQHHDYLMLQAESELQALRSELRDELEIAAGGGKIAWVDVGWGLSSAAALNIALGIDAPCFCIGSHNGTPMTLRHYGYLFEREQPFDICQPIMAASEAVELIFSSTRPSTAYLKQEEGKLHRITKPICVTEILRQKAVEEVCKGVCDFVASMQDLQKGMTSEELRLHNRAVVAEFCAAPPHDAYKRFARLPHDRLAGNQAWQIIGDFWRPNRSQEEGVSMDFLESLKNEIIRARKKPLGLVKDKAVFKLLAGLSKCSPPLPKRMTNRFAKSAKKRDPGRDIFMN